MKNKNILISILVVVIVAILVLIIFAFVGKDKKDNKKDNKKNNEVKETKYEVKEQYHDNLVINDIKVEVIEDQTIVSFSIKNKGTEVYPEGIKTFSIESKNVPAEKVTSNVSSIAPGDTISIDIVINGTYDSIDAINIEE